ncbi:MAG: hypothetical protein FD138_2468 [Planctomycetota bacterium]|nr:MAG: hypothetical protein FD138_2468 [Planctomycetota bacterium]
MAPEQWENTHTADGRSDLYALGCTLFYLLTGRAPFSDEKHSSLVGKMKGHTLDPIPDLKAARAEAVANRPKLIFDLISDDLDTVYRRLMAKRPEERFESATELTNALIPFGKQGAATSAVLVKGRSTADENRFVVPSSPVAPRQESRTSLNATNTTDPQPKSNVTSTPGNPVAERQGYSATAPLLMTEFEPSAPAASLDTDDAPTFLAMFAGDSSTTQHDVLASDRVSSNTDHSLARRAKPSGFKLGLILGGLAAFILLGVIVIKSMNKGVTDLEVAANDDTVKVEITNEVDVKPIPKKKRVRQSAAKAEASPSVSSAKPAATTPVEPNPPPKTPESTPATPVVTSPKPTTPEPTTATSVPGRTLIVGIAPGEIGDIAGAIAQATPGDTILIRHRGPLEFPPVDLTGKTPLTIAGDVKDGVDYWPILRQAVLPEGAAVPPAAKGLFFGKKLQLTLRKVHLGIGGHRRQPIESVFHLDVGKLEFADCTVTVAASGVGIDPVGSLIPLVQCAGPATEPLELRFQRTLVRGGRLSGCLNAVQPGPIRIVADQFLWAGGPAPWLTLQECGQPCRVQLEHSTLYNLGGLAVAALTERKREMDSPILSFQVDHCLLTGPRVASPPLLQVTAPEVTSLAKAVSGKWLEWKGASVVWHQINSSAWKTDRSLWRTRCFAFVRAEWNCRRRRDVISSRDSDVRSRNHPATRTSPSVRPPRNFPWRWLASIHEISQLNHWRVCHAARFACFESTKRMVPTRNSKTRCPRSSPMTSSKSSITRSTFRPETSQQPRRTQC